MTSQAAKYINKRFANYRLMKLLGSGSFAEVYLGQHLFMAQQQVAIKILTTQLEPSYIDSFLNEARTVSKFNHPNIVRIYDCGLQDGVIPYIVMEYAPDRSLRDLHPGGTRLELPLVVKYIKQAAAGLQYAHDKGFVHRDVKPHNMLIGQSNEILMSDFGAVVVSTSLIQRSNDVVIGSPAYMAPEQGGPNPVRASDQYSLGVVVYEWLSGSVPFRGSVWEIFRQHATSTPPPLHDKNPSVTPAVEAIIMRALEKDPKARFESVQEFADALEVAATLPMPSIQTVVLPQIPSHINEHSGGEEIVLADELHDHNEMPLLPPIEPDEDEKLIAPIPIMFSPPAHTTRKFDLLIEKASNKQAGEPDAPTPTDEHNGGSVPLLVPVPPMPAQGAPPSAPSVNQSPRGNTGKFGALGGNGAGAPTVALAPAGGAPPLPRGNAGGGSTSSARPPRRLGRLLLLGLVAFLLLSLLLVGGIAIAAPGMFGLFGKPMKNVVTGAPAATITITPKSQQLSNSFTVLAVTGTPNTNQRQVQARVLTFTTAPSTKTANATGGHQTPATNATGSLTFYNSLSFSQSVGSHTVFTLAGGVQIENTIVAVIPAAHAPTEGSVTVSARAVTVGSKGNIPPYTLNGSSCCASGITVSNPSAFYGGQDAQNVLVVQQSDVNNAAAPLETQLTTQAMSTLVGQKHTGEQFVRDPACSTKVAANPPVGAKANSTTVTVTATCTGEVYDASGAQALAATLLKQQAATNPGAHYALAGSVQVGQPQVTTVDGTTHTVELLVKATGVWVYQFSDADKLNLAQAIARQSKEAATTTLFQQAGVAQVVSINLVANGTALPSDPTQIDIMIQSIRGLPGLTPTASPPSGGPTGTPISSPTQGNG